LGTSRRCPRLPRRVVRRRRNDGLVAFRFDNRAASHGVAHLAIDRQRASVQSQRDDDGEVEPDLHPAKHARQATDHRKQAVHSPSPGDRATRLVLDRQDSEWEWHSEEEPERKDHEPGNRDAPTDRESQSRLRDRLVQEHQGESDHHDGHERHSPTLATVDSETLGGGTADAGSEQHRENDGRVRIERAADELHEFLDEDQLEGDEGGPEAGEISQQGQSRRAFLPADLGEFQRQQDEYECEDEGGARGNPQMDLVHRDAVKQGCVQHVRGPGVHKGLRVFLDGVDVFAE